MDGNPAINRIGNSEAVLQYFGYWPSFHDAEIKKVTLEANRGYHASATFLISASEMTRELDDRGHYRLVKQCDIELQFSGIKEMEFDGFNHQNVILELVLEGEGADLKCTFDSSVGMEAVIVSEAVTVLSLTPTN